MLNMIPLKEWLSCYALSLRELAVKGLSQIIGLHYRLNLLSGGLGGAFISS